MKKLILLAIAVSLFSSCSSVEPLEQEFLQQDEQVPVEFQLQANYVHPDMNGFKSIEGTTHQWNCNNSDHNGLQYITAEGNDLFVCYPTKSDIRFKHCPFGTVSVDLGQHDYCKD